MINEKGEIEVADTVPKLVTALGQAKCEVCEWVDKAEDECHKCNDLMTAGIMLELFDKLVMLYNQAHRCLDAQHCKVCLMVAAYGLDIAPPEEENLIVSIN